MAEARERLRQLPSVDALLGDPAATDLTRRYGRDHVVKAIRSQLDACRQQILESEPADIRPGALLDQVAESLHAQNQSTLRPVINASGIIIHTNLGRAALSDEAREAMAAVAGAYNTLEYDLEAGARGSRFTHARDILRDLTGAQDAIVVNNNAAALVLILNALAQSREVIISRGQLVEIGGGFRIPDIMAQAGAKLVEVGTTNRTRIDDFNRAIGEDTRMLLRVHASNFKQVGFVQQPAPAELTACAGKHGILAVDDLGSGSLIDTAQFGLAYEPTIQDSVKAGFDLICFSGDKLLGGPQAGIIIGKAAPIDQLKRHPLARALRVDKLTYAALIATLRHFQRGEALEKLPVWRMIARANGDIKATAARWAAAVDGSVLPGRSAVGGGSLPGATLDSWLLAIESPHAEKLKTALRHAVTPVIARVADGRLLLDPRAVLPEQEADLLHALRGALAEHA